MVEAEDPRWSYVSNSRYADPEAEGVTPVLRTDNEATSASSFQGGYGTAATNISSEWLTGFLIAALIFEAQLGRRQI